MPAVRAEVSAGHGGACAVERARAGHGERKGGN